MDQNLYPGTDPLVTPTSDEKTMALLSHILAIAIGFVAPLIIYLIKKDESAFVLQHAKESLNFQITVAIIMIALLITVIGIVLMWLVAIAALVFVILATIKASEGKLYRYPFSIRLIK